MMRGLSSVVTCFTLTCLYVLTSPVIAQDMRVYTSVTDLSVTDYGPQVISHSLTLFHAGKAYDYMEQVGEVVVFEPMHNRFIILGKNGAATKVTFTELNHFLESARKQSHQYIQELSEKGDPTSLKQAATIEFQLKPELSRDFQATKNILSRSGGHLNYLIECAETEQPAAVKQYLDYADWFARLNYVLHPHSAYPEARLQVNASLRELKRLPVKVELKLGDDRPIHLRADHSFSWEFQSVDRLHISHWEQKLESEDIRWMTFHQYQQKLLVEKTE